MINLTKIFFFVDEYYLKTNRMPDTIILSPGIMENFKKYLDSINMNPEENKKYREYFNLFFPKLVIYHHGSEITVREDPYLQTGDIYIGFKESLRKK